MQEPSEVAQAVLGAVAEFFARSVSFMVRPGELAGDRAYGLNASGGNGPTPVSGLRIPLGSSPLFQDLIERGRTFYGESHDPVLREDFYGVIGVPANPTLLLLPLKSRGKVVGVAYGDFGAATEPSQVPLDALEIIACEAGIVLENVLYRRHIGKTAQK
jgi:hypothetical protein